MISLIVAFAVGLGLTLFGTPHATTVLVRLGWAQQIRVDGPQTHHVKKGTPTKGGLVFGLATMIAYFAAHLVPGTPITPSGLLVLFMMVGMGLVGFIDDYLKTHRQNTAGLSEGGKLIGQLIVVAAFVPAALLWTNGQGQPAATYAISFTRDLPWADLARWGPVVGLLLVGIWVAVLALGTTNAVNFTDGLDGLLVGAAITTMAAYVFICLFQMRQSCAVSPGPACYTTADPQDLAVISTALLGSLAGYLWWACRPAKLFMGDTGSLGLGGIFVALAVLTRTEMLFGIIGFLYLIIAGSSFLQRYWFKLTKGKRLFKMAPLHHHFELLGWAEETITTRFWIIAALSSAAGVVVFYGEWLLRAGLLS
ncbi:phospho-N-acetylmuramoyl-pentapeptide-transferase [Propionibacteriaceae bacterium Y2011]|uniref:phospho-N-acetylmuramoyl-pentapeptide- transferase n=1 Tax=Microlunatus sp. Y2014 TaxID=3418488 RepID=UPI003B476825